MKLENTKDYIAGLFEGDGHISIAPTSGEQYIPRWNITGHIKDLPALEHIKGKLGHGFIRRKQEENAVVWTVGNLQGILKIIEWLNGRLCTPKIYKFNEMIDWINTNKGSNIEKRGLRGEIRNNAWFSGFVDADGNFYIRTTMKKEGSTNKKERIAVCLRIDQRLVSPEGKSYGPIMQLIEKEFKGNLSVVQKESGKTYYHIDCQSKESLELLNKYFTNYPLLTSKYLDYVCWNDAWRIKGGSERLTEEDKKNILILKKQMNKSRKYFSWQHLEKSEGSAV